MWTNYLIFAIRNLSKNKLYTGINMLGLSIGIACCIVEYSILRHELNFDSFHSKSGQIFRVVRHEQNEGGLYHSALLPNPMGAALEANKGRILDVIPMHGPSTSTIEVGEERPEIFRESGILMTNSAFLRNLDFSIVKAISIELLDEPNKVFITEKIAEKYFGGRDPLGQYILYDEKHKLEVVGVIAEPPSNTNTPFQFLVSHTTLTSQKYDWMESWGSFSSASAYVVVRPDDSEESIIKEISSIVSPHLTTYTRDRTTWDIQPITDIHTNDLYDGNSTYVLPSKALFGSVSLVAIILIVSILNFVNLSTAQAIRRSKEVGIRKTLGGSKGTLMFQFLGETGVMVAFSAILALTVSQVAIDQLNRSVSSVTFDLLYDLTLCGFVLALVLIVTVMAGVYPALVLSRFNPVSAFRNQHTLTSSSGRFSLRRGMVIVQFSIACILIVVTLITSAQMRYFRSADLGFNHENVWMVNLPERLIPQSELIKNEFEQLSFIEKACRSMAAPTGFSNWSGSFEVEGKQQTEQMRTNVKVIDEAFLDLYEIPLIQGRNLTGTYFNDTTIQMIVTNDFLVKSGVHPDSAIGTHIEVFGMIGRIIGVTADYNAYALQRPLSPVLMAYSPEDMGQISIKLRDPLTSEQQRAIERVYRKYGENELFEMSPLEGDLDRFYQFESTVHNAFQGFALLAIVIGVFGLYGLVSFLSEIHQKSISIRKIFGAGVLNILSIFAREYLVLILIAFLIGSPIAYWVASEWLSDFTHRIPITVGYFAYAILALFAIVIITSGYKSLKTAQANPTDTLRSND